VPSNFLHMYHKLTATSSEQEHDVCVVGAGPVGITVALQCETAGLSVLLLEAGQAVPGAIVDGLRDAEIVDGSRHAPLEKVSCSGLGGTSGLWGGRCVPFDDIDFERRPFVRHSGWPISAAELECCHAEAAAYLDCGSNGFTSTIPEWDLATEISCQTIERLSSQPRLGRRFHSKLRASKQVRVRFGEIVQGIELNHGDGQVSSLRLASGFRPSARLFVLACGGLQNTRILLDLQRDRPRFFGGEEGPLGRFYMGHLTGRIASIVLQDPRDVESFDYQPDREGYWYRRRFSLPAATQLRHELLNTVFWLGNPPFYDPSHRSAAASTLYLQFLLLERLKYVPRDFVSFHRGDAPTDLRAHLTNVGRAPADAAKGLAKAIYHELSRHELKPFFLTNRGGVYSLHYHSEQIPQRSNRVRLKPGSERLSIDFHYCDEEVSSIVRAHEILDSALRRTGKGYLKYWQRPEERMAQVLAQADDGYHQIGTVRMGQDAKDSVVDRDCRVHGLKNLYVAGSAVFPTSGQANPTFTAVALAKRMAGHLACELSKSKTLLVGS
jgi:hypothetical protein